MELRLGFRITLVLVILAFTLSGERVEAQRAGKTIKTENSRPYVDFMWLLTKSSCICLLQGVKMSTMTWRLSWIPHPVLEKRTLRRSDNGWPTWWSLLMWRQTRQE